MEAFIEAARQAVTVAAVDFGPVQQLAEDAAKGVADGEALRETITTLVDTYSAADSSQVVLQCSLMKAIGSILCATASNVGGGNCQLAVDDYILLALFFNEISTVGDVQLFSLLTEAVTALFRQTAAVAFKSALPPSSNETEDCSSITSLRGELQSLRFVMAKRLVGPSNASEFVSKQHQRHDTAMQLKVIDCLRVLLLSLLEVSNSEDATLAAVKEMQKDGTGNEAALQAARQVVEGLLLPLSTAVDALRPHVTNNSSGKGRLLVTPQPNGAHGTAVSPLVLVSTFRVVEELLWHCAGRATDDSIVVVGRFAANRLLTAVQQYLVLQQQKSVESTGTESQEKPAAAFDVLRAAGPQRAIRRLLSVVHRQLPVFPSIESAVTAAIGVFGGQLDVDDPLKLTNLQQDGVGAENGCNNATDVSGDNRICAAKWEEAPSSSATSRLRECEQILPAPSSDAVVNEGAAADFDDPTLMEDGADGGPRETLLKSTVGPLPANALVEMVFLSISRLDIMNEQGIQLLHMQGLQQQQYEAVRRAQRAELQRLRRIEQQGVENIPVGRLLEHLKESTAMYAAGAQLLSNESGLATMQRAALFSLLDAYDLLVDAQEGRVREAQALIARTIAQMPSSMMDSALDAVCARLKKELAAASSFQKTRGGSPVAKVPPLTSAYQLALQVLFMLYSAQAPVHEHDGKALMFAVSPSSAFANMGGEMQLQSRAVLTIDTENPVDWLQAPDMQSSLTDRKRPRDDGSSFGGNDLDSFHRERVSGSEEAQSATDGPSRFFREDSIQNPCVYSHFLCRMMEVLTEGEMPVLLLDLLLQCPRITRYVWHYLHKHYCLSPEKARCLLGMWLLKSVAARRAVCRRYALNSLLYMTTSRSEYPRRLAVKQLGALLASSVGLDGRRVIDDNVETLLVRHAKRQIAAIPVTRLPTAVTSSGSAVAKQEEGETTMTGGDAAETRAKELQKLTEALDRHLGPFLMLCARQPRELIPALLDVFKECVERQNTAMVQLLADHVDVRRMCQRLFQTDALSFMSNVMPYLRRYSNSATMLVQRILWAVSAELRSMGKGGEVSAADLEGIAAALLGHARVMYENSEIPFVYHGALASNGEPADVVSVQESPASLHDVRFIAPFMSLIPMEELKRTYLRSFLHFVEQQLQQRAEETMDIDTTPESMRMSEEEMSQLIRDVAQEVLVRSPVQFSDGSPRGVSRVDLLVYLHHATRGVRDGDAYQNKAHQSSPHSTVVETPMRTHAETRGILSSSGPQSPDGSVVGNNAKARTAEGETSRIAENLPLSALTTKEVICVLLKLRRTFDESTTEYLYGPAEIKGAVRQLMKNTGATKVPSQLMATLIFACGLHPPRAAVDLVRFVHQEVLLPLAKDGTWEKDVQLWRGVLLFAEMHYRECSSFLVNLPDQVLIEALRVRPQLCEYFREEHGNNAYFGHILGSL
ncbi:hypothetical protein, conserved [Trypanosoma brucei gambiense DAL972]|uniref:Symplekin C-terminal domain-containing protein n=1 Tax=Trypanosoma brucei gambiense (strain MHOM/CI/86/DAL972) TaxID=679716 RepID=C9ZWP1_TRYB9|nr:hypothetical protein, conserved [Trypanosoma brucei gambiense DAL972]CBH13830.1 hypothetical protein, conserved [Trypanosoma brucei gambiense DAL972]|eukprot:XP_011776106.1 hypothetical protein, conserved [Trypanosoma brucei gambiense DAL972]